jgi:hypothetical protein
MEGWLYGLFTLLGVIFGGLFTFLGLWRQLEQQKELNKREWLRKVRSDPLLKLRSELASMASKLDKLAKSAHSLSFVSNRPEEQQTQQALNEAVLEWDTYIHGNDLEQALKTVDNAQVKQLIRDIRTEYLVAFDYGAYYRDELTAKELGEKSREIESKIDDRVTQAQALINKILEEF